MCQTRINYDTATEYASGTMMDLLTKLSPNTDTLSIVMICNMITGLISNSPTPLQIELGVLLKDKEMIQHMHKFGIVCSYDEVRRFRKSAAKASTRITNRGLVHMSEKEAGLIQVVVDHFDCNISSQNGLKSTHALAMLLTQTNNNRQEVTMSDKIRRIRKEETSTEIEYGVSVERFRWLNKTVMPKENAKKSPLSLKLLIMQALSRRRSQDRDFQFLNQITSSTGP